MLSSLYYYFALGTLFGLKFSLFFLHLAETVGEDLIYHCNFTLYLLDDLDSRDLFLSLDFSLIQVPNSTICNDFPEPLLWFW
jgi:hypothetical protein